MFRDKAKGVKAYRVIQDLTYTAVDKGVAGNDITINYNAGGSGGAASVAVATKAITVTIEAGVTTATTIATAINADTDAKALVLASVSGTGTTAQAALDEALNLYGGLNEGGRLVVLGSTLSSRRVVTCHENEVIEAGTAVRLADTNALSTDESDGELLGVSLGKGLSKTENATLICRKGFLVPIKLTLGFYPTIGAKVYIDDDTGLADAHDTGNVTVTAAVYKTGIIAGEKLEDGSEIPVALIDMEGGL